MGETVRTGEDIIEPALPIIDPHHHLWFRPGSRYLFDDFLDDVRSGHAIRSTMFVECGAMYRRDGPEWLRGVGEAEFVRGMAAMAASGLFGETRICEAMVGYVDLRRGDLLEELVGRLQEASGGRLRGIRQSATFDGDNQFPGPKHRAPPGLMSDPAFRAGLARLPGLDLTFDAVAYHPQLPELAALARAVPTATIIVNHCGFPLGIGTYAGRRTEIFAQWKAAMAEIASEPNTIVKLGGLGMPLVGFGFGDRPEVAHSTELAAVWRPYVETAIDLFGVGRAMFESNFPVDRHSCGYATLWNAFKLITCDCSDSEKMALYSGTAAAVYRLRDASPVPEF